MKAGGRALTCVMYFRRMRRPENSRWRMLDLRAFQPAVQPGGGNTLVPDHVRVDDVLHQLVEAVAGLSEMGTARSTRACGSRRSVFSRKSVRNACGSSTRSHLLKASTAARPSRSTRSTICRSCFSNGSSHQNDNDGFGKAYRTQRIGNRKLFQLFLNARLAAHAGRIEHLDRATTPVPIQRKWNRA